MKKLIQLTSLSLLGLILVSPFSVANSVEDGIAGRIAKVGSVCIEGDACAANLTVASAGPQSAEDVYNSYCMGCHASGAAGAPKFRDAESWASRLGAGLESMYANSISGKGAMPPKGLCMSCSDEEIKATVDYMIEGL